MGQDVVESDARCQLADLRISLLGLPRVELDGVPLTFERRKALALLAYLAVTQRAHSRDALATLLWAEQDAGRARNSLRRALIDLNRAVGKDRLTIEIDRLGLPETPGLYVDVVHFRRGLAEAAAHSHPPYRLCDACLAALNDAASLYRADFLAGFTLKGADEFDAWQTYQTEALRLEYGQALERLATGLAGRRQYAEAIIYTRRWLSLDPLNEAAHRLLMRLFAWAGDRAASIHQYEQCTRVLAAELGLEPEPETTGLYRALMASADGGHVTAAGSGSANAPALVAPPPLHNLPPDATPLIGRERELAQIADHLAQRGCRLLTLVGHGGIGKTRLAIQAARNEIDRFNHGVYFVDLAPAAADAIASTILHALQVSERGSEPEQRLLDYLHDKEILLVLDNYEHLVAGADPAAEDGAGFIARLLAAAPHLKLLVTSRTRLNLRAEWLAPVPGLQVPPLEDHPADQRVGEPADHPEDLMTEAQAQAAPVTPSTDLEAFSASAFFLSCVRRLRPDFAPAEDEKRQIVRICRLLDGTPLALELAAGRTRTLALETLAAALQSDMRPLATTLRDVPLRHRSMRAVFEYSWQLLSPRARSILRQLSVFRGGFSAEAASSVSAATPIDLEGLVDASWLRTTAPGRFDLHGLVRQYCAEKLSTEHAGSAGEAVEPVQDRHAAYYQSFIVDRIQSTLRGKNGWVEIAPDMDNVMAAWDRLWERGDLAAIRTLAFCMHWRADRLGWYRTMAQVFAAAHRKLDALAQGREETAENHHEVILTRATFLTCQIENASRVGLREQVDAFVTQAMELMAADPIKDREWQAVHWLLRRMIAWHKQFQGDSLGSSEQFRELLLELAGEPLPLFPYTPDAHLAWRGEATYAQGFNALALGRYDEAIRSAEESIAVFRELGNEYMVAYAARVLALCLVHTGAFEQAQQWALASLKTAQAYEDRYAIAHWQLVLGRLYTAWDRRQLARIYLRRNLALTRELNLRPLLAHGLSIVGDNELASGNTAGARLYYEESLACYPEAARTQSPALAACLNGLGQVLLAAGEVPAANSHFLAALTSPLRSPADAAASIAALAQVALRRGEIDRSAELLAFVSAWAATPYALRVRVEQTLQEMAAQPAAGTHAAASARGKSRRPDDLIAELIGAQQV